MRIDTAAEATRSPLPATPGHMPGVTVDVTRRGGARLRGRPSIVPGAAAGPPHRGTTTRMLGHAIHDGADMPQDLPLTKRDPV